MRVIAPVSSPEAATSPRSASHPAAEATAAGSVALPPARYGAAVNPGTAWVASLLTLPASSLACLLACMAAIALGSLLTLSAGLPHITAFGHDNFILFDGAWRVLNGQRPHVDFYSGFGPVAYLAAAAGLAARHLRPEGIVSTTAVLGAILGIWGFLVARSRLAAWSAILVVLYLTLLWLAPFPLGEVFYLSSYAMQYNRLGYVLVSLILLEQFCPSREHSARHDFLGGLSTGAAAAFLLFLKMNYFVVALGVIGAGAVLMPLRRPRLAGLAVGVAIPAAAFGAYLHWDFAAMFRDVVLAGLARGARLANSHGAVRSLSRNMTEITGFCLITGLAALTRTSLGGRFARQPLVGIAAFAGLVLACDVTLACSNTQRAGFPLTVFATILLAQRLVGRPRPSLGSRSSEQSANGDHAADGLVLSLMTVGIALLVALPSIAGTINAWGMIAMERSRARSGPDQSFAVDAPLLQSLRFEDHADPTGTDRAENNGRPYVQFVNEGLHLLRAHSSGESKIACLCFSNPFAYALLRPPARGGSTFFDYGTNFTELHLPEPAQLLGDAALVLYSKSNFEGARTDVLLAHARPLLSERFRVVGESEHWVLYEAR